MAREEWKATHAKREGALAEWTSAQTVDLGPRDAVWTRPSGDEQGADEREDLRVAANEDKDDQDRDERGWNRGNDLRERVRERAQRTPPAGRHRDRESSENARQPCDDRDDQRRARAGENETEEVTAEDIGAERIDLAGRERALQVTAIDDEVDRFVRRDALAEQGDEKEGEEGEETDGEPRIDAAHLDDLTG